MMATIPVPSMAPSRLGSNVPSPPDALRTIPTNPQVAGQHSPRKASNLIEPRWRQAAKAEGVIQACPAVAATVAKVAVQGGISCAIGPPLMPRGASCPNPILDAGGRSELRVSTSLHRNRAFLETHRVEVQAFASCVKLLPRRPHRGILPTTASQNPTSKWLSTPRKQLRGNGSASSGVSGRASRLFPPPKIRKEAPRGAAWHTGFGTEASLGKRCSRTSGRLDRASQP
ncbi:hypothetical protein ANOM_006466 [Aspergillus nomiae NRRL 13137]|uniref:Uncharacterized protein n=1 Tax=Aspergillus nomiae NRRL (strain ATCC 15546 / NRRL 13137 / CBS 260.88 / M93) TaxID=1509407 RepID=A0A0L1J0M6_ASPN3|nr:uncharacterized protein ANOM_006466 [Aspergillus nomiae NRRL 13137]KNG85307.1 hypothetical protein ANOM_006466 [Aspergillus nomiae NRRL 13137]